MNTISHKATVVFFSLISLLICAGFCSCGSTKTDNKNAEIIIQDDLENLETDLEENVLSENFEAESSEIDEKENQTACEKDGKIFAYEDQEKFYNIRYTYDYTEIGEDLDYKIMVNDETKEVIIQFEESDSDEDWKNNYLFFPWPLKLDNKIVWTTYGYAKVYKSAQDIPFNEFYKQIEAHPDYKVVIWGWSIGSAMAKITARHFEIRTKGQKKIDELTTWGDVKCWYNYFYSVKKRCVKIREYVTPNDLITWCIPICRRDVKNKVGDKYSIKKSFK